MGIEIGEAVHRKRRPVGGALGKLTSMWSDGIFVGCKGKTGEVTVADGKGRLEDKNGQKEAS